MKLLTVSPYFESHRGGVEIVAGRLARELAARGLDVTWLASNASPPPDVPASAAYPAWNVAERRLGIPYPLPGPAAIGQIGRAVRASDAVLVHDALYAPSVATVLAARRHRKPVLMVQHIGQIPYRSPVARGLMALANATVARWMLGRADQVVFISETTARFFQHVRLRRPPMMIYNGVDSAIFHPADAGERAALRAELKLDAARPQALFVGRFVEKKGLAHLQRLAALRPDIDFNFAGWGPLDPSGWAASNVRVFPGRAGASLAALYRACDALVLPSVGEGFPLVVQEALACGLAVVCGSETGEADPAAGPLLNGVEIADDPEVTAARLSPALDAALGQGADAGRRAELARSRYDWSAIAERYHQALAELTAAPPAGARRVAAGPANTAATA